MKEIKKENKLSLFFSHNFLLIDLSNYKPMKYFLVFFLPVLIFSQQDNLSDGTGSYRQYFDENKTSRKHVLKNVMLKILS